MRKTVQDAWNEGRAAGARGLDYNSCPYGQDQKDLRGAWCAAALEEAEKAKPWLYQGGPVQTIVGWVIFLGGCALAFKVLELIFGMPQGGGNFGG